MLNPFDLTEQCHRRNRFTIQVFTCMYIHAHTPKWNVRKSDRGRPSRQHMTTKKTIEDEKLHCKLHTRIELFRGAATSCGNYSYDLVRIKFQSSTFSLCVACSAYCMSSFYIGSTVAHFLFSYLSCLCCSFFLVFCASFFFLSLFCYSFVFGCDHDYW